MYKVNFQPFDWSAIDRFGDNSHFFNDETYQRTGEVIYDDGQVTELGKIYSLAGRSVVVFEDSYLIDDVKALIRVLMKIQEELDKFGHEVKCEFT